jgi:uncharacterized protein YjiS (DUF1127 family)
MTTERLSVELHCGGESTVSLVQRLSTRLARWRRRAQGRSALAQLGPLERRDVGLSDADVWRESRKPPWQA